MTGFLELAHAKLHLRGGDGKHLRLLEGRARLAEKFLSGTGLSHLLALPEPSLVSGRAGSLAEHELTVRLVHLIGDEWLGSLVAVGTPRLLRVCTVPAASLLLSAAVGVYHLLLRVACLALPELLGLQLGHDRARVGYREWSAGHRHGS